MKLTGYIYNSRICIVLYKSLYNRKSDVFDHFGSAFNNMKFRLFCPFLTIPLVQTN